MSRSDYFHLLVHAEKIGDAGDFTLSKAESNPEFHTRLAEILLKRDVPKVIWEPYAGHTRRSYKQGVLNQMGVILISFDLTPFDDGVQKADSLTQKPDEVVGGVFFHPPYWGSSRQSEDSRDLSWIDDWNQYVDGLRKSIGLISEAVCKMGVVCAVGRSYRHNGKSVRLGVTYLDIFEEFGFRLDKIWISEPDVALVLTKVGDV